MLLLSRDFEINKVIFVISIISRDVSGDTVGVSDVSVKVVEIRKNFKIRW